MRLGSCLYQEKVHFEPGEQLFKANFSILNAFQHTNGQFYLKLWLDYIAFRSVFVTVMVGHYRSTAIKIMHFY